MELATRAGKGGSVYRLDQNNATLVQGLDFGRENRSMHANAGKQKPEHRRS